MRMTG